MMKLTLTVVTFIIASISISATASPVLVDANQDNMTLIKRVVGVNCTPKSGYGCIARREMNNDQFEEVGLVKRTRHKHRRHRHGRHHHGHKSKGMAAMPPPMAMGGDASGAAGAGGMAAGVPDMTASAGGADMSAAQ